MRRAGLLSALLLTAALLYIMPGLLSSFVLTDSNRMDERLRPAESRTLTIWLVNGGMDDGRLLSELCSGFEKANRGLRVFLRRADAEELYQPGVVPPDGVLYSTGDVVVPEKVFLPLSSVEGVRDDALHAGSSGGVQYAVPLWLSPNVLSLPTPWLTGEASVTSQPDSFFGLNSPAPSATAEPLNFSTLPWRRLMEPGALWIRPGVAWQQMLFVCPAALSQELIAACPPGGTPSANAARAWRLKDHLAAVKAGEALTALVLPPAVSDQVRFVSLCRDTADGRHFIQYLLDAHDEILAAALLPAAAGVDSVGGEQTAQAEAFYEDGLMLPNAFAHTREELNALCLDGWLKAGEPVETLLKLR